MQYAMLAVCLPRTLIRPSRTNKAGLYYKLHGVHRPMTMKKSIIKRRKRVIPASGEGGYVEVEVANASSEGTPERGTVNPDGSVNLGSRNRPGYLPTIEPEPGSHTGRQASPLQSTDPAAYHSTHTNHQEVPRYLTEDNRLASLASIATTEERQPSLSPASFVSPSRKRSFSAAETDASTPHEAGHENKRVSSIISILNPSSQGTTSIGMGHDDRRDCHPHPSTRSPASTSISIPSPGPPVPSHPAFGAGQSSWPDGAMEGQQSKSERRQALRREAERMRELLAQKERELDELGRMEE
jgi:GATA-binding protein, other eukaryote